MPGQLARFRIEFDGAYSRLTQTEDPSDEYQVFATFGEARAALLTYLRQQRDLFVKSIANAQTLTRIEVERGKRLNR